MGRKERFCASIIVHCPTAIGRRRKQHWGCCHSAILIPARIAVLRMDEFPDENFLNGQHLVIATLKVIHYSLNYKYFIVIINEKNLIDSLSPTCQSVTTIRAGLSEWTESSIKLFIGCRIAIISRNYFFLFRLAVGVIDSFSRRLSLCLRTFLLLFFGGHATEHVVSTLLK